MPGHVTNIATRNAAIERDRVPRCVDDDAGLSAVLGAPLTCALAASGYPCDEDEEMGDLPVSAGLTAAAMMRANCQCTCRGATAPPPPPAFGPSVASCVDDDDGLRAALPAVSSCQAWFQSGMTCNQLGMSPTINSLIQKHCCKCGQRDTKPAPPPPPPPPPPPTPPPVSQYAITVRTTQECPAYDRLSNSEKLLYRVEAEASVSKATSAGATTASVNCDAEALCLTGSVGIDGQNNAEDVQAVNDRLDTLGFKNVPSEALADRIRFFQCVVSTGCNSYTNMPSSVDGLIAIDGFTHKWLMASNAPRWTHGDTFGSVVSEYGVQFVDDDDHGFGTSWAFQVLLAAGRQYQAKYRAFNPSASAMSVNDLSTQFGGASPHHSSHQTGMDVDLRPPRTGGAMPGGFGGGKAWLAFNYDREAARAQLSALSAHPAVESIFYNDPELQDIPKLSTLAGHDGHYHVMMKEQARDDVVPNNAAACTSAPSQRHRRQEANMGPKRATPATVTLSFSLAPSVGDEDAVAIRAELLSAVREERFAIVTPIATWTGLLVDHTSVAAGGTAIAVHAIPSDNADESADNGDSVHKSEMLIFYCFATVFCCGALIYEVNKRCKTKNRVNPPRDVDVGRNVNPPMDVDVGRNVNRGDQEMDHGAGLNQGREDRGPCSVCGQVVQLNEPRERNRDGTYVHIRCLTR